MHEKRIERFAKRIKNKIKQLIKTPLDEEPFGIRSLERLDVGDLVKWSELSARGYSKEPKFGIISELYLDKRGNRDVALARVYTITNSKNNLSLLGNEKEVLVVNLELISKVGTKNEQFSL